MVLLNIKQNIINGGPRAYIHLSDYHFCPIVRGETDHNHTWESPVGITRGNHPWESPMRELNMYLRLKKDKM
jgi:hypothetical protein